MFQEDITTWTVCALQKSYIELKIQQCSKYKLVILGLNSQCFCHRLQKKLNPKPWTLNPSLWWRNYRAPHSLFFFVFIQKMKTSNTENPALFSKTLEKLKLQTKTYITIYRIRYESDHAYKLCDDDSRPKLPRLLYVSEENLLTLSPISQTFAFKK